MHKYAHVHKHLCMCTYPHGLCYPMISEYQYLTFSSKERPSNTTLVLVVYCGRSANQHVLTVHVVTFRQRVWLKHVATLLTNCNTKLKAKLCHTAFLLIKLLQTQCEAEHKSHNLIFVTKTSTMWFPNIFILNSQSLGQLTANLCQVLQTCRSFVTTVSQQHCHNSKLMIFHKKLLKILKCYNFL